MYSHFRAKDKSNNLSAGGITMQPYQNNTAGNEQIKNNGGTKSSHNYKNISLFGIAPKTIQPKLSVNTPGDKYEQEADAMADKVIQTTGNNSIQRKCSDCEEEEKIQRKPLSTNITPLVQTRQATNTPAVTPSLNNHIETSRGCGKAMDSHTRSFMSNGFGVDFSHVKIHADHEAASMNKELNAKAFTVGNDIYFNEGEYQPGSSKGKHLLAHELTHTIQQGHQSIKVQRDGPGEHPLPPVANLLTVRVTGGRIEVIAGTPALPVAGSIDIGVRREGGRYQFIAGRNGDTYSWQDILEKIHKITGGSGAALPSTGTPTIPLPGQNPSITSACLPHQHPNRIGLCEPDSLIPPAVQRPFTLSTAGLGSALPGRAQPSYLHLGNVHTNVVDNFPHNGAQLPSSADAILLPLVTAINTLPASITVYIDGHSSTEGTGQRNMQLSLARASAIKARLIALGVTNGQKLVTAGKGDTEPLVTPDETEEQRSHNRRVEIWYVDDSGMLPQLSLP